MYSTKTRKLNLSYFILISNIGYYLDFIFLLILAMCFIASSGPSGSESIPCPLIIDSIYLPSYSYPIK